MLALALIGGLLVITLLTLTLMVFRRNVLDRQRRLQESEDRIYQLHAEASELNARLETNAKMSEGLKEAISKQLEVYTKLVEMQQTKLVNDPSKFSKLFEESYKNKKPDSTFWKSVEAYADSTHNGLIGHLRKTNEELIESDLRFLSLCCCYLPTSAIMACMGYNDPHSVYNKKHRIAEILKLDERLETFIRSHESG